MLHNGVVNVWIADFWSGFWRPTEICQNPVKNQTFDHFRANLGSESQSLRKMLHKGVVNVPIADFWSCFSRPTEIWQNPVKIQSKTKLLTNSMTIWAQIRNLREKCFTPVCLTSRLLISEAVSGAQKESVKITTHRPPPITTHHPHLAKKLAS